MRAFVTARLHDFVTFLYSISIMKIALILGTTRRGRQSEKVFKVIAGILEQKKIDFALLDPRELSIPVFEGEDYEHEGVRKLTAALKESVGVIVVTPEYNHSIPGTLKNMIDFCRQKELMNKPLATVGVSSGAFGGVRAIKQLENVWVGVKGIPLPIFLPTPMVEEFDAANPPTAWLEKANGFVDNALAMFNKLASNG